MEEIIVEGHHYFGVENLKIFSFDLVETEDYSFQEQLREDKSVC